MTDVNESGPKQQPAEQEAEAVITEETPIEDIATEDAASDNALFCVGPETCHVTLVCQAGTLSSLDDGVSCAVDSCNEATDTIAHVAMDSLCDNGLFCDGVEFCDQLNDCQDVADPCATGACDELNDVCTAGPVARLETKVITEIRFDEEPSIEEMLADPIVRLLMRRDGVLAGDVRTLLAGAVERLSRLKGEGRSEAA